MRRKSDDRGRRDVAVGGFDEGPDPRPFAAVGVLDDLVLGFAEEVTPFVVFFFLPQMGRANGDEIDVFVIRSR